MKRRLYIAAPLLVLFLSSCGGGGDPSDSTVSRPQSELRLLSHSTAIGVNYDSTVQQLYVAYFGRPADTGGLENFKAQLALANAPADIQSMDAAYTSNNAVKALIDSFGVSVEANSLYGNSDTAAFVTAIYTNVLNRLPDPNGLQFWVSAIDQGILTKERASFSIMAGAMGNTTPQGEIDKKLVKNKIDVASNFTHAITNPGIYVGDAAAATVRKMLAKVNSSTDPSAFQPTIIATLRSLETGEPPEVLPPPVQTRTPIAKWRDPLTPPRTKVEMISKEIDGPPACTVTWSRGWPETTCRPQRIRIEVPGPIRYSYMDCEVYANTSAQVAESIIRPIIDKSVRNASLQTLATQIAAAMTTAGASLTLAAAQWVATFLETLRSELATLATTEGAIDTVKAHVDQSCGWTDYQ